MKTSHALKLSSGGLRRGVAGRREGDVLVVVLPGLEAVVEAGDVAQCDLWFPPIRLPVGFGQHRTMAKLPVLREMRMTNDTYCIVVNGKRIHDCYYRDNDAGTVTPR